MHMAFVGMVIVHSGHKPEVSSQLFLKPKHRKPDDVWQIQIFIPIFPYRVRAYHEFIKKRASPGVINHAVDSLFLRETRLVEDGAGNFFSLLSPSMGDVSKVRLNLPLVSNVFQRDNCHG
jgi:hypothetical protein